MTNQPVGIIPRFHRPFKDPPCAFLSPKSRTSSSSLGSVSIIRQSLAAPKPSTIKCNPPGSLHCRQLAPSIASWSEKISHIAVPDTIQVNMKTIFEKLRRFFNENWQLAVLDLEKGLWRIYPHIYKISCLKAHNAKGRHIFMQPLDQPHYLLVDDLDWITVKRHHKLPDNTWKPGRMVVETSAHNFQVWIRSGHPLSLEQKRSLLKMLQNDPGADPNNRFGRCPGFRNRKDRHQSPDGKYPLCKLIWIDWLSLAHIPQHLLQHHSTSSPNLSHPPRGGVCLQTPPSRCLYQRNGESETDFSYALALSRKGYPDHIIRSLIIEQRTSWQNHLGEIRKNAYINRTIAKARSIINQV